MSTTSTTTDGLPHGGRASLIAQTAAELIVADRGSPPANGQAVMGQLERAFHFLQFTELTVLEFNVVTDQPYAGSRIEQLRMKLASEDLASSAPAPPSSSSSASGSSSSGRSPASPESDSSAEFKKELVDDKAALQARLLLADASSYAPRALTSTTNSLANAAPIVMLCYLDPLTGSVEAAEFAASRAVAQRLLERVFLPNHPHVIQSCPNGNIAAIWGMAKALCVGNDKKALLDAITAMVNMVRAPPTSWPALAALLARLDLRLAHTATDHESLHVGSSLLPEFCLRALQHSNFDYLRLEVAMLHKINTADGSSVSLKRIVQDMGVAHSMSLTQGGSGRSATGFLADYPAQPTPPVCFFYRDHGHCRHGENCRFTHVGPAKPRPASSSSSSRRPASPASPLDTRCLACGAKSHGIQDCPRHKEQRKQAKEKEVKHRAELARVSEEVAEMKALLSAVRSPPPGPTPAPLPGPAPPPPLTGPQAEIDRLRAELAASHARSWQSYSPYGH